MQERTLGKPKGLSVFISHTPCLKALPCRVCDLHKEQPSFSSDRSLCICKTTDEECGDYISVNCGVVSGHTEVDVDGWGKCDLKQRRQSLQPSPCLLIPSLTWSCYKILPQHLISELSFCVCGVGVQMLYPYF